MIPRDQVPLLDEGDEAFDALAGLLSITDLSRALEVARASRPARGAARGRAQ
jgi:hypothetical protein